MTKFEKEMGMLRTADERRAPVAEDPNKSRAPGAATPHKPFCLRITHEAAWRGAKGPWVSVHRYRSAASRAQARKTEERRAATRSYMKIISIEEFEE